MWSWPSASGRWRRVSGAVGHDQVDVGGVGQRAAIATSSIAGMTRELRSTADVTTWFAAGLLLRRVADDDPNPAIVACATELPSLPPPGVIADIAALLNGARIPVATTPPGDDAMRTAIRTYD